MKTESECFVFKTPQENKEIPVWYYKPEAFNNTSQIVFVMHGKERNGKEYRDAWFPLAKAGGFLLIVPELSTMGYPGSAGYNCGNMFSPSGERHDEPLWSYTVIEDLFDHIKTKTAIGSKASAYSIYGHSAGAQFVHRLMMFKPNARVQTAIAANAGWYTMPTDDLSFPYGLKNSGVDLKSISVSFGKHLIILLGKNDTDENHKYLSKTDGAMEQGKHRLARGRSFYKMAKNSAKNQKVQLKWKLKEVPGIGHNNSKISIRAATLLP